jgi:response regulator RpfG family c-di-GMP phosphodiesterase
MDEEGAAREMDLVVQLQASVSDTALLLLFDGATVERVIAAMRLGVTECVTTTASDDELAGAVLRAAQRTAANRALRQQREESDSALELQQKKVEVLQSQLTSLQQAVIEALLTAQEAREVGAKVHSQRVRAYAAYLAEVSGYPKSLRPHLERAALLHDIGKIALPDTVLRRPGVLMPDALEDLKPHAVLGEQILDGIEFLRPAALIVRHHHERFDGSGYPDGLTSEAIPLGARLFSIVDALDAVTNNQNYRTAQPFEDAIEEIARWSGRQFDPYLVAQFRQVTPDIWMRLREQVEEGCAQTAQPSAAPGV